MPKKQKSPEQPVLLSPVKHNNQRLFSDYFLDHILPKEASWQALRTEAERLMSSLQKRLAALMGAKGMAANEAQTERDWIQPVLLELGHTFEVQARLRVPGTTQQPDYVFYASEEQRIANRGHEIDDRVAQNGAIAIGDAKQWDRPLDQMQREVGNHRDSLSNKNPSFQIFFYMLHSKLPWGILTNGRKWRLYHESSAYKLEVFYEIDLPGLLENGDVEEFLYFYVFFRRAAFNPGHPLSLDRLLTASTESSQKIREDLREQVYDALRHVAQGFFDYPQNQLAPTPENRRAIYENSLILLYRLLFILYAESRDLLPLDEGGPYRKKYSLTAIKKQTHDTLKNHDVLLVNSGIIWAQLKTLFVSINAGNKQLNINTFDGGLFDPEKADFLERYVSGDLSLAQAIEKLTSTQDVQDPSRKQFIDYRDLSERHLGTIYEGLLEYTLQVASEAMVELRSTSAIVPEREAAKTDIIRTYHVNEVYLVTDSGRRKTTGSYYTPDYIVKYMVEQTLQPVLDAAVQGRESDAERIQAVLSVNVLDPAMGSGHFPVEVVEYIARYLVELGVQPEGKDEHEADMTYWKRRVAQQCIYGVDMNPLAVELAKLSLWLATAAKGYPLNFLDHHLRPGNALIGVWLEEAATGEHPKAKLSKQRGEQLLDQEDASKSSDGEGELRQFSMLEDEGFRQNLHSALDTMSSIELISGNTISEVKRQEAAYEKLRQQFVEKYQSLMHLGTALFYEVDVERSRWGAVAEYAVKSADQPEAFPFYQQHAQVLRRAEELGQIKGFFHWELEFPSIFFDQEGKPRGEQAGFDVVIGNPPYVRQEKLWEDKPFYQDHYDIYHGTADLFVYFFAQGLRLLRPGGRLAYISSNTWLRANYATKLRRYLKEQTTVEQIIDLGNTRVFADAPDLSPAIQIVRRLRPLNGNRAKVAIFSRGDRITEFRDQLTPDRFFEISIHNQQDAGWQLKSDVSRQLFTRLLDQGKPLGEVVEGKMYRGILTGLNAAFIIDHTTRNRLIKEDPACASLLKPLVRGEDLRPWYQEDEGRWLICLPSGWTVQTFPEVRSLELLARERLATRYPGLMAYLESVEETARQHIDQGQFWWEWSRQASAHTNLSPIFFLDDSLRERLLADAPNCAELIQPAPKKDHDQQKQQKNWLLVIPDGWTLATFPELESPEILAWEKFAHCHPSLAAYLEPFATAARKRQDRGQFWWELRPCDYYNAFEQSKIFFPDITRKPRFSWGNAGVYTSNTGYFIPTQSYSLLGILNSRLLWFALTQTSQPLGERKGTLIYRLFTQFVARLPIPQLTNSQSATMSELVQQLIKISKQRYSLRREMTQRIKSDLGAGQGKLTQRLEEWWLLSWQEFRDEVRKSFKREIPLKERGEWEALLQEQGTEIERCTTEIIRLEEDLNAAMYAVFGLNEEEIKLVEQETKYQYGEW